MTRPVAVRPEALTLDLAREVAAAVADPELPTLTLADLGILREVEVDGAHAIVTVTPTYSGCPAMREIAHDLTHHLERAGFDDVTVRTRLAPAWTSEWITAEGRGKLQRAGIAPPGPAPSGPVPLTLTMRADAVPCPRCGSANTVRTADFSSTACKALHRCRDCAEPFESVKAI